MIYTSYYYQLRNLTPNQAAISISRLDPKYTKLELHYDPLAPNPKLFKLIKSGEIDLEAYKVAYKKQLHSLNPSQVLLDLKNLAGDREIILMCHCSPDGFCHRFMVGQWLQSFGHSISELNKPQASYNQGLLQDPQQLPSWLKKIE